MTCSGQPKPRRSWPGGTSTPVYTATRDGSSALDLSGRLYTLRPWVSGAPLPRAQLNVDDMSLLGRTLGWCHRLLAEVPVRTAVVWPSRVAGALEEIEAASQRIAAREDQAEADGDVLKVLAHRRTLLENAPDLFRRFGDYRSQILHGDYHGDNVIVDADGGLAGVIDLSVLPDYPTWALYYAQFGSLREWDTAAFDMAMPHALVGGYLDAARITADEMAIGPEMLYWWLVLATWDTRRYAHDAADLDARCGILWFHRLATWLRDHGQRLDSDLARQMRVSRVLTPGYRHSDAKARGTRCAATRSRPTEI